MRKRTLQGLTGNICRSRSYRFLLLRAIQGAGELTVTGAAIVAIAFDDSSNSKMAVLKLNATRHSR
jgi:hypothetical protein